jgi:type IV secretion system protein VirB9
LYEIRDGAPNLVPFQVEHGTYIVPKVLERGYLAIGKQTWVFATAGR